MKIRSNKITSKRDTGNVYMKQSLPYKTKITTIESTEC